MIKSIRGGHFVYIDPAAIQLINPFGPDKCVVTVAGREILLDEPAHLIAGQIPPAPEAEQDSQPLFPPHLQPVISHPVPTLHIASTPPGTARGFAGHCYMDTLPSDEQTP